MKTKKDDIVIGQAYYIDIKLKEGDISFRDYVVMIDEEKNEIIFGEVKITIPGKFITASRI